MADLTFYLYIIFDWSMVIFVINSMTGFGRGEYKTGSTRCIVEIRTVNHKNFDYSIRCPKELYAVEDRIRDLVKTYISRGKADIFVTYVNEDSKVSSVIVDAGLVKAYIDAISQASQDIGMNFEPRTDIFFKIPDAFTQVKESTDADILWQNISPAFEAALVSLTNMRHAEALRLITGIEDCFDRIAGFFTVIEQRSELVPAEYKEKLETRLAELMEKQLIDEQRIAAEVAVFADRACIDEELVRFRSHIAQFKKLLGEKEKPATGQDKQSVGKKMDFIIQEMNREINTMGSKANDLDITNSVISIKSEIEKIREQVQNIE